MKCILLASLFLGTLAFAKNPAHPPQAKGSAEFEKIKTLVGTWTGTMKEGDKEQPVTVSYRLTGGGSAVVETWHAGTPMEMVSVYHDRKGKLSMTHYCMLGNQPTLRLTKKSKEDGIALSLVKNSIDDPKEQHMGALVITFKDPDHIVQTWTLFTKGEEMKHPIELARKK